MFEWNICKRKDKDGDEVENMSTMEEEWGDQPKRNRKSTEIFSPSFEPAYYHARSSAKEPIEEDDEANIDLEGCEEIFEQLQALVIMSPDCEFFADLYDEMIDIQASIREKEIIIEQPDRETTGTNE
mmetsp:Transcript_42741/g.54921  ORF Transcript_42741/g.54921 Transcript_42741/m.54921 type:complete len:127 (+) Transcript_42741:318-698(+)